MTIFINLDSMEGTKSDRLVELTAHTNGLCDNGLMRLTEMSDNGDFRGRSGAVLNFEAAWLNCSTNPGNGQIIAYFKFALLQNNINFDLDVLV